MNAQPSAGSVAAFDTALGRCAVRWTPRGIAGVHLPSRRTADLRRLEAVTGVPATVCDAITGIISVLGGADEDLRFVVIDETGVDTFQREVYAATRRVRPGSTTSYGEIARSIGWTDPEAARRVGTALARNPVPIVVPCHRVLAANGRLTGFSAPGGLETKRRMLELEGAPGFGQQVLFG